VPHSESSPGLSRRVIVILSLACGVSVANIYFPQAVSPLIAAGLRVSPGSAALVATASQLGYAAGLFLLVPLGDRVANRRLVVALLALTGLALLGASQTGSLPVLVVASGVIGLTTVVPQILIPLAVGLAPPARRGAVTGAMLSGLLGGILLARVFGGTVGAWLGWRAPYLIAGVAALALTTVLGFVVPETRPSSDHSYPALLGAAWRLLAAEPGLRRSGLYQAAMFGGFSGAWTCLALLVTGPAYHLGAQAVGLLALVGAASVFCTPLAGRWVDRNGPDRVSMLGLIGGVASAGVLLAATLHHAAGLIALGAGMLLLDVAVQCGQVANQARIFALRPDARSRVNTAYMTCVFIGGSAGSWLGVRAYLRFGWPGVCALLALFAAAALIRHLVYLAGRRPAATLVSGEPPAAAQPAACEKAGREAGAA